MRACLSFDVDEISEIGKGGDCFEREELKRRCNWIEGGFNIGLRVERVRGGLFLFGMKDKDSLAFDKRKERGIKLNGDIFRKLFTNH